MPGLDLVACDKHAILLAIPFAGPALLVVGCLLVMATRDRLRAREAPDAPRRPL